MNTLSLPVLLQDRSRLDWRVAKYDPEVRLLPTRATVFHILRAAPTLERLVREGLAQWATELRCPKTLFARVEPSAGSPPTTQSVEWKREHVDGDLFLIPGLVALEDFDLSPGPEELTSVWENLRLRIRAGWWLAQGLAFRTRTLGQSLLKLKLEERLPNGQMRIERDESADDLRFHVHMARDIWPERRHRHIQVAALIGAMGRMVGAFESPDEDPPVVGQVRTRLRESGVSDWSDPDRFDPARAATVIEEFRPTPTAASGNTRHGTTSS